MKEKWLNIEIIMDSIRFFLGVFVAWVLVGCGTTTSLGVSTLSTNTLESKYATPPSDFMMVNGVRLHYRDQGSGPVILLMHGVMSSLYTWDGWVDNLKSDYRVITIDVPPFGLSGRFEDSDYSTEKHLELINAFLNQKNIEKVIIGGNSYGGYLAWNFAARHPEKVSHLIMVDPGGYELGSLGTMDLYTVPVVSWFATQMTPYVLYARNYRLAYSQPEMAKESSILRDYDFALKRGGASEYRAFFARLRDRVGNPAYASQWVKKIKAPTLILWGKKDHIIPVQNVERFWKKDLPHAHVILYDDLGHIPMDEDPVRTVVDVMAWLKNNIVN